MGLLRPYRALLLVALNDLGLTPQAILFRPFRATEECKQNALCKGFSGDVCLSAPIPDGPGPDHPFCAG